MFDTYFWFLLFYEFLLLMHHQIFCESKVQAFRFMVGPGHCPIISKYGPSLSKAMGPVDPSFLVVKISHFNKRYSSYSESTSSTKQTVHVVLYTHLKQPLKKRQNKDLTNGRLMKVERIAECSPWSILQYF